MSHCLTANTALEPLQKHSYVGMRTPELESSSTQAHLAHTNPQFWLSEPHKEGLNSITGALRREVEGSEVQGYPGLLQEILAQEYK